MISDSKREEPGTEIGRPREIEPSAAAARPGEQKLGEVVFKDIQCVTELQTENDMGFGIPGDECGSVADSVGVEGWVAGVPVCGGVADSGWQECEGGRVRFVARVKLCPAQREWVRAQMFGGAYAQEVLG